MKRIVILLAMVLMLVMLVAGAGIPASAQTLNVSPTIHAPTASNDNVGVQCVADPLLGTPSPTVVLPGGRGGGDQCTQSQ